MTTIYLDGGGVRMASYWACVMTATTGRTHGFFGGGWFVMGRG